jgi:hypothetical protein
VVFDNATTPTEVHEWLPQGPGQVIVTSRHPNWGQLAAPMPVDVFSRTESVALLRRLAPTLTPVLADQISDRLGDLPLAITQAGGVLTETGIGGQAYLTELDGHTARVMGQGQPAGYPRSLAVAIGISLDRIGGEDVAAVQLLRVCAVLAPEPVPLDLFTGAPEGLLPEPFAAVAGSALGVGGCVARLGRYGLVKPGDDGPILHRLTQAITLDHADPDTRTRTRGLAEQLLTAAKPKNPTDPVWWPVWARLLPHLLALDPATTTNPELRVMAEQATWYLLARGDLAAGHTLAEQLYQAWRDTLGDDHPVGAATTSAPTTSVRTPWPADGGSSATTTPTP